MEPRPLSCRERAGMLCELCALATLAMKLRTLAHARRTGRATAWGSAPQKKRAAARLTR